MTCHWHHARFDLESGCTFDLWADDVPTFPVELIDGEVWVKTTVGHADPAAHWRQRLADGLDHDLGLVIAKAVHGQLAADVPFADTVRQVALKTLRVSSHRKKCRVLSESDIAGHFPRPWTAPIRNNPEKRA